MLMNSRLRWYKLRPLLPAWRGSKIGTPLQLVPSISGAGAIASSEAFGVPTVAVGVAISNAGAIGSSEAFGGAVLAAGEDIVNAGGIASAEAFGTPLFALGVAVSSAGGIASAEGFGVPTIGAGVQPEVFVYVGRRILPARIKVGLIQEAGAIESAEAFGQPTVTGVVEGRSRRVRDEEWLLKLAA